MKRDTKDMPKCIYCGNNSGETKDHVPPKAFFPKPRPSDLITVPCCSTCNVNAGFDEEFFLATFLFGDAGVSEAGKRLWDEKLNRMYEKNAGLRRKIAANLKPVEIRSPSGLYIRKGMAVQLEDQRLLNVIEQTVRGLYYFEFADPLPITTRFISHFVRTPEDMNPLETVRDQLLPGTKEWPTVFQYRFNRVDEKPVASIWVMRFWGVYDFWAATNEADDAI